MVDHKGTLLEVRDDMQGTIEMLLEVGGCDSQLIRMQNSLTKLDALIAAVPDDLDMFLRVSETCHMTECPSIVAIKLIHDATTPRELTK